MDNDRALLEKAANADGRKWKWVVCPKYPHEVPGMLLHDAAHEVDYYFGWNPLAEDADAFDLMVDVGIEVFTTVLGVYATHPTTEESSVCVEWKKDKRQATREAITRCAAIVGDAAAIGEQT